MASGGRRFKISRSHGQIGLTQFYSMDAPGTKSEKKRTWPVPQLALYDDPKASSNLEIWRVYRDGEVAHFQNQLPWYSDLPSDFQISEMSRYIQDRVVISAEGNRYSEWDVPLREIELFLERSRER